MTFWITASIVLFIITMVSAFGPYLGLYGQVKEEVLEGDVTKDEFTMD